MKGLPDRFVGSTLVEVRASDVHGRGLFAREDIEAGVEIEVCPVLRLASGDSAQLKSTVLETYYFSWGNHGAVAFGFGSLYNHSGTPNAAYEKMLDDDAIRVTALRDIETGEEVTFDYGKPVGVI